MASSAWLEIAMAFSDVSHVFTMKFWPHPSIPPVVQYQSQSSNIALGGGIEEHDGIIGSGEKIPWFHWF